MEAFTISQWRIIYSPPGRGAWNMALDEAILESVGRGEQLPALRLYSWSPPCLSLGYSQPSADVDADLLKKNGWDMVRRPTGGRAILHTDELTYAVMAHITEPRLAGGVLESYRRLSQALLAALRSLDIPAQADQEYSQAGEVNPNGAVCFERPSNYEITVGGKKLIGSAQARRRESVLQHGSLPLHGDLTRITQVLVFPEPASRLQAAVRLLERATTVETVMGTALSWEQAAEAFVQAFQKELSIQFIPAEPSAAECQRANELVEQKYAHPSWNERV